MDPDPLPLELLLNGRHLDVAREGAGLQADRSGHPRPLTRHRASHHVPHCSMRSLQKRTCVIW